MKRSEKINLLRGILEGQVNSRQLEKMFAVTPSILIQLKPGMYVKRVKVGAKIYTDSDIKEADRTIIIIPHNYRDGDLVQIKNGVKVLVGVDPSKI